MLLQYIHDASIVISLNIRYHMQVVKNLRKSCDDHVNDPYRSKVYEDVDTLAKTMSDSTTTW